MNLTTKICFALALARLHTDLQPEVCPTRAALSMEEAERLSVPMLHLVAMPEEEQTEATLPARDQASEDMERNWEFLVTTGRLVREVEKAEGRAGLLAYLAAAQNLPLPIARLAVAASLAEESTEAV